MTPKMEELRNATTEFEQRLTDLRWLIRDLKIGQPHSFAMSWLPSLPVLALSVLALGVAIYGGIYGGALARPAAPSVQTPTVSLTGARLFALFPDGSVEVTDPWAGRRIFRWTGQEWQVVDAAQITGGARERLAAGASTTRRDP